MELKNILCPVDFSEASVQALKYAALLSLKYEAVLHVFHTIHIPTHVPDTIGFGVPSDIPTEMLYENEHINKEKIEALVREVFQGPLDQVAYDVILKYGFTTDGIEETVSETRSDLVVMYTSGADTFLEYAMGTVAGQVVKNVLCPVLVLPQDYSFTGEIKEIVYSTDLISEENATMEWVVSLARTFDAHISFISIEKHAIVQSGNFVPFALNELHARTSYKNISFQVNEAEHVVEGLQSFAEEKNADIVVMTMHSRNFIKKLLEKSKTKEMVFQSKRPVLAFHAFP